MLQLTCVIVVLLCLLPAKAVAEPQFEIAGGFGIADYRKKAPPAEQPPATPTANLLPIGWFGSVAATPWNSLARKPWKRIAVVAEVTGEYSTTVKDGQRVHQRAFVFLDGVRVPVVANPRVVLFGEVLVGVIHDRRFESEVSSANRFVWRPAGGIDVTLTRRVAARFQGGARFVPGEEPAPIAYQYLTGIVVYVRRP